MRIAVAARNQRMAMPVVLPAFVAVAAAEVAVVVAVAAVA